MFFHVACLVILVQGAVDPLQVWLAWVFIAGRVAHSGVQILTTNVRLRGLVFTIDFLAVLSMWGRLVLTGSGAAA